MLTSFVEPPKPSEAVATAETAATINSQIADRPLAKQAAKAQEEEEEAHQQSNGSSPDDPKSDVTEDVAEEHSQVAVLTNNDSELDRVLMVNQIL